ncbi:hypothetical protein [Hymenobacter jeollabukensis]|uniref:DUF2029 domain-containing protein n=1 Tax=Hymenobacter jeollabukensis TaxID=2025313 RepID=A0A5R8WQ97_9BACT|nr:hypothetical protein [Hymenobacter jeollabukensis]TLM92289.1 hypothetical protein FDY95_12695 [Hymenobacter jeollabukensis]
MKSVGPRQLAGKWRQSPWRYAGLYALLFGLLLALGGSTAHEGDRAAWLAWATHIFRHGLGNAYALPSLDYNPLYHYILWLFGRLAGSAEAIGAYSHGLKAFTLLFDFAGALLAASWLRGGWQRFLGSLWLLLNVGYLYNTLVWQQVDAIFTTLSFAAVVLALRQRPGLSLVLYVLALNAKLQAIVFLPLLGLLWLPLGRLAPRQLLLGLGTAAAVQLALLAPFIWGGAQNYLPRILAINFTAVSLYPYTTVNAFNVWTLLMPDALFWVPDTLRKFGLSYRQWGLLAFGAGSALALVPVALLAWQRLRRRSALGPAEAPLVLLVGGLLPLVFCFFNTEMHERYWHPAVLFLGAYALLSRRWWPYALVSVGHWLNLRTMFRHYHHQPTWLVQHPQLVAGLFALGLLTGFYCLYQEFRRRASLPMTRGEVAQ